MKGAMGLAKIPVIVALLVLAAGGASFQAKLPVHHEPAAVTPSPEGDVPVIGEMTVTATRSGN
jgi:hypothetical protein